MRGDVFIEDVLSRCEAYKQAGLWPGEPECRPNAWLHNFDEADRVIAAILLEHFTFYNERLNTRLLRAAYGGLGDGRLARRHGYAVQDIMAALRDAVFTRVDGETPRPTDSGNLFCRTARQQLAINDRRFLEPEDALRKASGGGAVVFLDDLIGSGDQFISSWTRRHGRLGSFESARAQRQFLAVYVCLVATDYGLQRVRDVAPGVLVTPAHVLDASSTVAGIDRSPSYPAEDLRGQIARLLEKYAPRLEPGPTISQDPNWVRLGYHGRGLMFAFSHTVPDSTLPIFWSTGSNWTPLVRRR